jgi:rare lipoprotein A
MKFWFATGPSIAALLLYTGAAADQAPTAVRAAPGDNTAAGPAVVATPIAETIIRLVSVTQAAARLALTTSVAPPDIPASAEMPRTRPAAAARDGANDEGAAAPVNPRHRVKGQPAAKSVKQANKATRRAQLATADRKASAFRCVGRPETGTAAWYGGRYVGRRTTSGSRLDTVHPTAAHRTLPLNSLARVTNLRNGRSIVVRVTDRGPIDEALLIDMSPRAADELRMKEAGLVPVRVEQVVEVPSDEK